MSNAFEMACVVAYKNSVIVKTMGSSRESLLDWEFGEWKGPYLRGLSASEFAREFVSAAVRRGRKPDSVLKLGILKKTDAYLIANTDSEGWTTDVLCVAADGSTTYSPPKGNEKSAPMNGDAVLQIPAGTAAALGIRP
ncbi:hypothetical protein QN239_33240 [Mycolicibacterium sp. Y3]